VVDEEQRQEHVDPRGVGGSGGDGVMAMMMEGIGGVREAAREDDMEAEDGQQQRVIVQGKRKREDDDDDNDNNQNP
jgi:hypothetical protein